MQDKVGDIDSESELKKHLPDYFFRTAYHIKSMTRIKIQSACQNYIDHSISSTINLPEDVEPEVISDIYLKGWEMGLKGITIYRDGSRFPILTTESKKSEFQKYKKKKFKVSLPNGDSMEFYGDEVLRLPGGRLSTPWHLHLQGQDLQDGMLTPSTKVELHDNVGK